MTTRYKRGWMRPVSLTLLSLAALTSACGGSDDGVGGGTPPLSDADAAFCNGTDYQRVIHPVAGAELGHERREVGEARLDHAGIVDRDRGDAGPCGGQTSAAPMKARCAHCKMPRTWARTAC